MKTREGCLTVRRQWARTEGGAQPQDVQRRGRLEGARRSSGSGCAEEGGGVGGSGWDTTGAAARRCRSSTGHRSRRLQVTAVSLFRQGPAVLDPASEAPLSQLESEGKLRSGTV